MNSEFISSYNFICDKVDKNDFSNKFAIFIPINFYPDDYHNKLAVYNCVEQFNKEYSNLVARPIYNSFIGVKVYKPRNNIFDKLKKLYVRLRENKAA